MGTSGDEESVEVWFELEILEGAMIATTLVLGQQTPAPKSSLSRIQIAVEAIMKFERKNNQFVQMSFLFGQRPQRVNVL